MDSRIQGLNYQMYDVMKTFAGWLTCVREPEKYLAKYDNYLQFSESDLQWEVTEGFLPKNESMEVKEYDLIYNAGSNITWHEGTKNWPLAVKCFDKLLEAMPHLKILIVGREPLERW